MTRKDGTGPQGKGPLTGRGWGDCIVKLPDGAETLEEIKKEVITMPGGDRTGPMGVGPRTGRGAGYCSGYNMPGYANPMPGAGLRYGRGMGRGRAVPVGSQGFGGGRGRGIGWNWSPSFAYGAPYGSAKEEAELLKDQAKTMQEEIEVINARIKELESSMVPGKNEG